MSARVACQYHANAELIEDAHAGDLVCSACGLVVVERAIDVSAEWRRFANDSESKDMSRVGDAENPLLDSGDLSTMIDNSSSTQFDENGRPLYKNRRFLSSSDNALLRGFREIKNMSERLQLTQIITSQANSLFKEVYSKKHINGRSHDAIASACVFMACRQEKVPRTFKEVCAVSRVSKKEIGKVFKKMLRVLETSVQTSTAEDFVSRFCGNLGLNQQVQRVALHIARQSAAGANLVAGRSPVSVVAAAIYMAAEILNCPKDKKEVAEESGVAESTMLSVYRILAPHRNDLIPPDVRGGSSLNPDSSAHL